MKDRDEKEVIAVKRLSSFVASIVRGAGPHGQGGSGSGGGSGTGTGVHVKNGPPDGHGDHRSGDPEHCPISYHAWCVSERE